MRLTKLLHIRMQLLGPWSVPCTKHSEAWVLNAPVFWVRVQLDAVFFSFKFYATPFKSIPCTLYFKPLAIKL